MKTPQAVVSKTLNYIYLSPLTFYFRKCLSLTRHFVYAHVSTKFEVCGLPFGCYGTFLSRHYAASDLINADFILRPKRSKRLQ